MKTLRIFITAAFYCGVLVSGVFSEEKKENDRWTPELSMNYLSVFGTAMSPDGQRVAYQVRKPVMKGEKSEYLTHIWLAAADGSFNFQFTQGEKSATRPSFSPDGKFLAFASSRGGKKSQIWLMRVQGGEAFKLTEAKNSVGASRWSPDGSKIAFLMRDPETKAEKKAKKEKRDVILVNQNFKYSHLYTIEIAKNDSGKHDVQRLTSGEFHVTRFDWSPDGQTIAFQHQADPRINTGRSNSQISLVPSDSGAVTPVVIWGGGNRSPRYSPDGKRLAFASQGGKPEPIGLADVYIIPAAGGEPKKLSDTPNRSASIVGWSGDGKTVYVTEAVRTSRHLIAVPADGKAAWLVTKSDGGYGSFSFDGKAANLAFTYQNLVTPVEVYVSSIKKIQKKKLSSVHADAPRPAMGKSEIISWVSKDGLEIEGILTYPIGYEKGRKYPLILNVHGGPGGVFSQRFAGSPSIYMLQYFAQNGYAIIRPNPRGSTGYGKDFRYANFKDWGFGDYEDLMSGVDKVIEMGVGHPDSLCLMGWSYGGYMTSFAVTRTDRFKAASMGAGLPNLISMVTTTDIPNYLVGHFGGEFWDDYETYEKHSAMYRIKNVVTPTQVIHGQRDARVPFAQGQEFYNALSRRGVPTEMVVYPRTPHGPREPKFLMDVSHRIMTWFEKHLGRAAKAEKKPEDPTTDE